MPDESATPTPAPETIYPNWTYSPHMDYGVITFADGRTVCLQGDDACMMDDSIAYAANLDPALVAHLLGPFSGVASHERSTP